jgi:hypothetical protein
MMIYCWYLLYKLPTILNYNDGFSSLSRQRERVFAIATNSIQIPYHLITNRISLTTIHVSRALSPALSRQRERESHLDPLTQFGHIVIPNPHTQTTTLCNSQTWCTHQ